MFNKSLPPNIVALTPSKVAKLVVPILRSNFGYRYQQRQSCDSNDSLFSNLTLLKVVYPKQHWKNLLPYIQLLKSYKKCLIFWELSCSSCKNLFNPYHCKPLNLWYYSLNLKPKTKSNAFVLLYHHKTYLFIDTICFFVNSHQNVFYAVYLNFHNHSFMIIRSKITKNISISCLVCCFLLFWFKNLENSKSI